MKNIQIKDEINEHLLQMCSYDKPTIKSNLEAILHNYKNKNLIYDYKVVCDQTNNFNATQGLTFVDVYLKERCTLDIVNLSITIKSSAGYLSRKNRLKKLLRIYGK